MSLVHVELGDNWKAINRIVAQPNFTPRQYVQTISFQCPERFCDIIEVARKELEVASQASSTLLQTSGDPSKTVVEGRNVARGRSFLPEMTRVIDRGSLGCGSFHAAQRLTPLILLQQSSADRQ